MKQIAFLFFLILLHIQTNAQNSNKIILGNIDTVDSKILGEKRPIWVYVPNTIGLNIYGKKQYPVIYLLDGDAHFYSVVGMTQQLSRVNGNTLCPEMIVVGIPNTDRTRDLTPTHINGQEPFIDSVSSINSGGGEKFITFIEKELMPYIESKYPTEPYKMLIGHSFGGLTVMNTFTHHNKLFNSYVAIDPSMWWDNQKLLKETKQALTENNFKTTSLFLAIANTMEEGMDTARVKKDISASTLHIRSILDLNTALNQTKQNQLKFNSKYYKDDDHGSVPLIASYDALHFIFDFYPLKLSNKELLDSSLTIVNKIEQHFKTLSLKMGYEQFPSEDMINLLAYGSLANKNYAKAGYLFKMNVKNFPKSFNVYDSLGDYYNTIHDKANAIESFKMALSIMEFPDTRIKLNMLLGK